MLLKDQFPGLISVKTGSAGVVKQVEHPEMIVVFT